MRDISIAKKRYIITISKQGGVKILTDGKVSCITAVYHKGPVTTYGDRPSIMEIEKDIQCIAMRGRESICLTPRRTEYGKQIRKQYESGEIQAQRKHIQQLEPRNDGKTNTLTTVTKDNMIMEKLYLNEEGNLVVPEASSRGFIEVKNGECFDGFYLDSKTRRGRKMEDKCNCLTTTSQKLLRYEGARDVRQLNNAVEFGNQPRQQNRVYDTEGVSPAVMSQQKPHAVLTKCRIRRLTPTECARLQTIPEWYEWKGKFPDGSVKDTSDTQIYKMCGNGWCVEVIKHIFSFIDLEKVYENKKRIAV